MHRDAISLTPLKHNIRYHFDREHRALMELIASIVTMLKPQAAVAELQTVLVICIVNYRRNNVDGRY